MTLPSTSTMYDSLLCRPAPDVPPPPSLFDSVARPAAAVLSGRATLQQAASGSVVVSSLHKLLRFHHDYTGFPQYFALVVHPIWSTRWRCIAIACPRAHDAALLKNLKIAGPSFSTFMGKQRQRTPLLFHGAHTIITYKWQTPAQVTPICATHTQGLINNA